MTNHHGEIDTTVRKTLDQRHSFSDASKCAWEFFHDRLAASMVESEVFEVAGGLTVLIANSRPREQSGCRNGEHEPVAHITLRC
jgi:hypothetical protein